MWAHLDNLSKPVAVLSDLLPANWIYDADDLEGLEARFGVVPVEILREPLEWWQHYGSPEIDSTARPVTISYRPMPAEPAPEQVEAYERKGRILRDRQRYSQDSIVQALTVLTPMLTKQAVVADELDVETMAALANFYPEWAPDQAVDLGEVREHRGVLYEVVQAHTTQADWTPDETPALWKSHWPADAPGHPEWVQPTGAHDAYALGAIVSHNGQLWESLIADNVWEPGAVGSEALWSVYTE